MKHDRGGWGSNLGFLMAAVGSAVGLGNIWGFPFKMGISGGFTFLILYFILAIFVGYTLMVSELSLGRKCGQSVYASYVQAVEGKGKTNSTIMKIIGILAMLSPFLIMSFYSVLGAYCLRYMISNITEIFGAAAVSGGDYFGTMLTDQVGNVLYTVAFMLICLFIVKGGIKGGIERFSTVAMPALAIMLLVIIVRSLTLPGAIEGVKFMFVPGYAVSAGIIPKNPSFITVLATAGGQMFFSLSLAMGAMVTYGSYLDKKENLVKNSIFIVIADTIVALMAGFAVIPAAFALGGEGAAMAGPKLLFVTLQDVFHAMGAIGPFFGVLFYLLVLIAAITSAISLMEVLVTFFMDRANAKGKTGNRSKLTIIVFLAILAEAAIVAWDGLGANGMWVPFQNTFGIIGEFNDCWLDFMDFFAEGLFMPLGALLLSIMVGWVIKPKTIETEVLQEGNRFSSYPFYSFCIRFVAPVVMVFILLGQINNFFKLGWF